VRRARAPDEAPFDDLEFELVKLFAGQVSIALRNAEMYQAAEVRARTDDLTGLLNHRAFKDRLAREAAANQPFGLVMIDLDEFKTANDTLGHQAGDRLLREIAAAIRSAARETDPVFRYGGDEFAVILPGSDADGLAAAAQRLLSAICRVGAEGGPWHDGGVQVGASIGIASFPSDGAGAADVLLAADRACFVAKRRGRGEVATAAEGLALARKFTLSEPTPVDPPTGDATRLGRSIDTGTDADGTIFAWGEADDEAPLHGPAADRARRARPTDAKR
jgi:diguanylate cyclase (GGDEF)-like protein